MARILLLTPQLPYPPHQGTSLRNYHMLKALAQAHEVTLLSFSESPQGDDLLTLDRYCKVLSPIPMPERTQGTRLTQLISSSLPDVALRLKSEHFTSSLTEELRSGTYDAVQVEGIELALYIEQIRNLSPKVKVILDCHNAETELQRRARAVDLRAPSRWLAALYSSIQIGRLAQFERWAMQKADMVVAVSKKDRDYLLALKPTNSSPINVIPNTIDITEYALRPDASNRLAFDLIFTGKMDYRPNIDGVLWFAEAVWPALKEVMPDITWAIVGQKPHPRLETLREMPGITITGFVPQIQPYLAGSKIYIVPLRIGSGTRLKILEAMAAGLPIVSTHIGAEGFDIRDGEEMVFADSSEEWVETICRLLASESQRKLMGTTARNFATRFDWRTIIPQINDLYTNVLAGNNGGFGRMAQ